MKRKILAVFCLMALAVSGCATAPAPSGSAATDGTSTRTVKRMKTWKDVRYENIVMQNYDYSCGAAALATLMNYYFNDPVNERDILVDIVDHLNKPEFENRKKEGLSLLDLKEYAERRGYQAVGVKLKPEALTQLAGPVMVYVENPDFKHFAVLRGVQGNRVFLADPSRGNLRMSIDRFLVEWPGIALVLGKEGFGLPTQYPLAIDRDKQVQPEAILARRFIYTSPPGRP